MDRVRKIAALCLAAVFLVTLTVFAAAQIKGYSAKVKHNGTNVFIQVMENAFSVPTESAYLKDSKNKVLLRWKDHKPQKVYRMKDGTLWSYFPYSINMYRFKPGKYMLVTHSYKGTRGVPFTYTGRTYLQYHSTKVVRNNNGDLVQRFYFRRGNANGKMLNAQIYNSQNQLVRSFKFKSGNSNQLFTFNWNGWPAKNSAYRCPRGVYMIKYWVDGASPHTAKFRLAI